MGTERHMARALLSIGAIVLSATEEQYALNRVC